MRCEYFEVNWLDKEYTAALWHLLWG